MPTGNNAPTTSDVTAKLATVIDTTTLNSAQLADIPLVLASVMAEFEAKPGQRGSGGTGKTFFTPITETRYFDGMGYDTLSVPELLAPIVNEDGSVTNPVTVNIVNWLFGSDFMEPLQNIVVETDYRGNGYTTIRINSYIDYYLDLSWFYPTVFPLNSRVAINGTWGYAANVPQDIFESIRSETAARILIASQGGVAGLGGSVKDETTEYRSATSTATLNLVTSAITTWRKSFDDCKRAYRDNGAWKLKQLTPRIY